MTRKTQSASPLIVVASGLVICAVFLAAVPNFIDRRDPDRSCANACINILRQLDGAAEQWRLENGFATNRCPAFGQIRLYLRSLPTCPQVGGYSFDTNSGLPKCSFPGHVLR